MSRTILGNLKRKGQRGQRHKGKKGGKARGQRE